MGRWLITVFALLFTTSILMFFNNCSEAQLNFEDLSVFKNSQPISVLPAYGEHSKWADFIVFSDPSKPRFKQPEEVCNSQTLESFTPKNIPESAVQDKMPCVHGGKIRMINTTLSGCEGFEAKDKLGVFVWKCSEDEQGQAIFKISGFLEGKGLRDLITNQGFLTNAIEVYDEEKNLRYFSEEENWWPKDNVNIVDISEELQGLNGVYSLTDPGKIYVVSRTVSFSGEIDIASDKITFLTLPGAKLTNTSSAGSTISASGFNFLWLEVDVLVTALRSDSHIVNLVNTKMSMIRNSRVQHQGTRKDFDKNLALLNSRHNVLQGIYLEGATKGLFLEGSSYNALALVQFKGPLGVGLTNKHSSYNEFITISTLFDEGSDNGSGLVISGNSQRNNIRFVESANGNDGIDLVGLGEDSPHHNSIVGAKVYNTADYGIGVRKGCEFNRFQDVYVASTGSGSGVFIEQSHRNRFFNLESLFNSNNGITVKNSEQNLFVNFKSTNNNSSGVTIFGSDEGEKAKENVFVSGIISSNGYRGVDCQNSKCRNNIFSHLTVRNNTDTGLYIAGWQNSLNQIISMGNAKYGIKFSGATSSNLSQIVSVGNYSSDFYLGTVNLDTLPGTNIIYSEAERLDFNPDADPGNSSDEAIHSFAGQAELAAMNGLGNDDLVFSQKRIYYDQNGEPYKAIGVDEDFAWFKVSMENPLEYVGVDGGSGNCAGTDLCAVYNAQLISTTPLYNSSLNQTEDELGDVANNWLTTVDGSQCGAEMSTTAFFQTFEDGSPKYIANAVEILGDGIGNEDGLCQQDEECKFSNHYGFYQGNEFNPDSFCITAGEVPGVKLYQPGNIAGSFDFTTPGEKDPNGDGVGGDLNTGGIFTITEDEVGGEVIDVSNEINGGINLNGGTVIVSPFSEQ